MGTGGCWAAREATRAATEPQKILWAVAQPPEAKVSGVAKPPPRVAELPQLHGWVAQPSHLGMCLPSVHTPKPSSWPHALVGWQLPLPPLRWLHLFPGRPSPPPLLPPEASEPALCPSWPGVAALPVWRAPYPGPSSWQPALSPPGHLDHLPKIWALQAKSPTVPAPVQTPSLQWGGLPCPPLCLPLLNLPPLAPPWASTPPTPVPHPGLEMTGYAHPPRVHWWCTSPGTTSPRYQCLQCPPQFGHLQFGAPSRHGTNLEMAGQGITDTGQV